MFALSLAQLRSHTARLIATGLAIIIAVGFVVATLVLNQTSRTTVLDAVGAQFRGTDAVITMNTDAQGGSLSLDDRKDLVGQIRSVPGVAAIAVDHNTYSQVRLPGRRGYQYGQVTDVATDPALRWQRMVAGRLPTAEGEVAIGQHKGVTVGTTLTLLVTPAYEDDGTIDTNAKPAEPTTVDLKVVGVVDLKGSVGGGQDQMFTVPAQTTALGPIETDSIRVAGAKGADPDTLAPRIEQALAAAGQKNLFVRTGEQQAEQIADDYTGDAAALAAILLVFATVAVLVCGLVIANTFAVLLAQRTRELALLRCVGATGKQLRRGVLIESLVIGAVASLIGVGAGIGLAAIVSAVSSQFDESPIPLSGVSVPLSAVAIGMAVGIIVTVVAAFAPARRATRVAPLAALRPMDPPPARSRAGLLRRAAGILLLLPSAAVLVYGAQQGILQVATAGGVFSFIAVVLLAQWLVPPVVALAGRLFGPGGGVPGRLAASNSIRNPQRTAATATALIIGVTLTTTMVVGAASTRATAATMLDRAFPTDVSVSDQVLPPQLQQSLTQVKDVQAVAPLTVTDIELAGEKDSQYQLFGVNPASAAPVVRSAIGAGVPTPGTINVPDYLTNWGAEGASVRIVAGKQSLTLKLHVVSADTPLAVASSDMARLDPKAPIGMLWIRLVDGLDADQRADAFDAITDAAADLAPNALTRSSTEERDSFDKLVNILLLIVTGLLGVAVVIAVIGVGNTIALSVVERRQESGLLRALGLTRAQLRWMLLCEALLIAGVAAVLGMALGVVYGVLGTSAALAGEANLKVDIPWLQLLLILVVATAAGALASVLPSRRAARTSPVAAIAA